MLMQFIEAFIYGLGVALATILVNWIGNHRPRH